MATGRQLRFPVLQTLKNKKIVGYAIPAVEDRRVTFDVKTTIKYGRDNLSLSDAKEAVKSKHLDLWKKNKNNGENLFVSGRPDKSYVSQTSLRAFAIDFVIVGTSSASLLSMSQMHRR
ncbi:hypothetical protein M9H77_08495 [Catharanthus roseus]|uniref:Uncharacterized protein n=1 Tax=Catharanthus roseus TaxID=4058 RepID=A0ACC0BY17_CATRO|nr:hypothetical protein M9H77_08495 [Catharanthus roseus]